LLRFAKLENTVAFVEHPWEPIYDKNSKVLILGTIPSPKSREVGFYYGHPQNIFWKTVAEVLGKEEPDRNMESMKKFLLENRIAVWDVLKSCEIKGASDSHIKNAIPNDFGDILRTANIQKIFTTGKTATKLFNQCCAKDVGMEAEYLPSTSPANRGMQAKQAFMDEWKKIKI